MDVRKIPKHSWQDTAVTMRDVMYRLSLAVQIPWNEINDITLVAANDGGWQVRTGCEITLWELKQRAYYFGQSKITERVEMYEAIMQVAVHIWGDEQQDEGTSFKIRNLSIAYHHTRPLAEYAKARREIYKAKRMKK